MFVIRLQVVHHDLKVRADSIRCCCSHISKWNFAQKSPRLQSKNILLNKHHTHAKVADVGVSRVLHDSMLLSMASAPLGTFVYCGE